MATSRRDAGHLSTPRPSGVTPRSRSSTVANTGRLLLGARSGASSARPSFNRGDNWEELLPAPVFRNASKHPSKLYGDAALGQGSISVARVNGDSVLEALQSPSETPDISLSRQFGKRKVAVPSPPPDSPPQRPRRNSRPAALAPPAGEEEAHMGRGGLTQRRAKDAVEAEVGDGEGEFRMKMEAKRFDAELCSFRDLVNAENNPTAVHKALERLKPVAGGENFVWERKAAWGQGHGGSVNLTFELILWYHNSEQHDVKTRVSTKVSFLHKAGCVYMFQPVLPITSLVITPRPSYRPMFEMDPRSFHVFKLCWRHYLDFGVSDYRIIVGEQLEQWTQRCKMVTEKPLNAVYWLMLMVGSCYREALVERSVLKGFEETFERVPVICVDSFVALSALLFSPERQVLYAGTDPTPSYLQWLQYVGDQNQYLKNPKLRKRAATVFEMNEFLDVSVIIVFYGRIQQKAKESTPLSWVGNPNLIKRHIAKYAEDNLCASQLEQAIRLYSYSCSLGNTKPTSHEGQSWFCWNGLRVCEIGVPMPSTQATFLSPFTQTQSVALLCPTHGPDAARLAAETKEKKKKGKDCSSSKEPDRTPRVGSRRPSGSSQQPSSSGRRQTSGEMRRSVPSPSADSMSKSVASNSKATSDTTSNASYDEFDIFSDVGSTFDGGQAPKVEEHKHKVCYCARYGKAVDTESHKTARRKAIGQAVADPEIEQTLQPLESFDLMHSFAAVLAAGLNLAKQTLRLHFSIDPQAYQHLPPPMCTNWPEAMHPWYCEFHRTDAHGRSRYGLLLDSLVRGYLGDGYTSGLHYEVLDIMRVSHDGVTREGLGGFALAQPKELEQATSLPEAPTLTPAQNKRASCAPRGPPGRFSIKSLQPVKFLERKSASAAAADGRPQPQVEQHEPPPLVASPPAQVAAKPSKQANTVRGGVINDMILWTELYETDSIFNHRTHFEHFVQWCHSAQLIPFLQRCYRRCGIAGLLVGQRCGGGAQVQTDPSYPLVLPTIPSFCYGQGYPLPRVFEYFYGGVDTIVASLNDPAIVEAARSQLPLIPGQERLNNLNWFQLSPQQYDMWQQLMPDGRCGESNLNFRMLQQLEHAFGHTSSGPSSHRGAPSTRPGSAASRAPTEGGSRKTQLTIPPGVGGGVLNRNGNRLDSVSGGSPKRATNASSGSRARSRHGSRRGPTSSAIVKSKQKVRRVPPRLGLLTPDDPFFWFCSQNFALCTYPADVIPRHTLSDGTSLIFRYSDVVSRTGTPEAKPLDGLDGLGRRDSEDSDGSNELEDPSLMANATGPERDNVLVNNKVVPPSICLCQVTELTAKPRHRWEIKLAFVDDQGLLLGDSGWFPGALGQRFIFEAKSDNVDKFLRVPEVPQAQVLYVEHRKLPCRRKARDKSLNGENQNSSDDEFSSSSASDGGGQNGKDGNSHKAAQRRLAAGRRRQMQAQREREEAERDTSSNVMLPPLLSTNAAL